MRRITEHGARITAAAIAVMVAIAVGVGASSAEQKPADMSGRWLMKETYPDYTGQLRLTWLEIVQDGVHVTIRAWQDDDKWTCDGRGRVEGNRLHLRWWGKDKYWRGTADLELRDDGELRGTFQRLDVHAGVQYCTGRR